MKRNKILSKVELSHEELKCLDFHFRQMQKNAVVSSRRPKPAVTLQLLEKLVSIWADRLKTTKKY